MAVVPETPRITLNVFVLVGSPLICTYSVVAGRRVDELEARRDSSGTSQSPSVSAVVVRGGDGGGERGRAAPVLVRVHQEVDALDRNVGQPGDERVAVREPVPDRRR